MQVRKQNKLKVWKYTGNDTWSDTPAFPSKKCLDAASKVNDTVLFSWFENDQETTSWFESKDSDIIYIRSLHESDSPISRKSLFSWWPLRYSPRKRFQSQQFDLYFAGRSFHRVLPRKFTVKDAEDLDQQILNRLFPVHRGTTFHLRFLSDSDLKSNAFEFTEYLDCLLFLRNCSTLQSGVEPQTTS